jgi:hypothetical protein
MNGTDNWIVVRKDLYQPKQATRALRFGEGMAFGFGI